MQLNKRTFIVIVCVIHAIYFAGSLALNTYMNGDSGEYINQATNLIEHGSVYAAAWDQFPHIPEYYSMRPPMYGILVLLTMYATHNPFVLLFAQSILSIVVWILIRKYILKFRREIGENKIHQYLILALIFNPVQLILCNCIFSDILLQFFMAFGFFFLMEFIFGKKIKFYFFSMVFFTLALLTKPVLVYFAYLNLFLAVYLYFKFYLNWGLLASALLLPFTIIIVSSIHKKNTGYYHYSSSKVYNIWAYNSTNFLNMKFGNDSGYHYQREIYKLSISQPDYKHRYGFVDSACTRVITQNLKSYLPFHVQGIVNFFIAPGREFINDYLGQKEAVPKSFIKELNVHGWKGIKDYFASQQLFLFITNILVTLWNVLLLLGLIAFAFSKRIPLNVKILTLIIIFYVAGVSSLAMGAARYKTAIYPMLLFCNGWIWLREKLIHK